VGFDVAAAPSGRSFAALLSVLAAFGWSTYYPLVLWVTPGAAPSAIIVFPFLFGGVAYVVWTILRGEGWALRKEFASPSAYGRTALLLGMQLSVLAATYLTGPVDAALLALLGDVAATPLVVALVFGAHHEELRRPLFLLGLALSIAGGSMAIAGGQSLGAVHDLGWLVVAVVPATVGFYFVLSARAAERSSSSAVVGQSMIAAAAGGALLSPLLPGGWAGWATVGSGPLAILALIGLSSFFVAPILYFGAIARVGLVLPPMMMTGIPVFTLILSVVLLGLTPPVLGLLGIPVAVSGGLAVLRAESSAPAERRGTEEGRTA
jgi:drug/metabolite transporter (DMT)-like permease